MTTFEILVAVAIIAIVMLLTAIGTFVKGVWENQKSQEKKLDFINKQIAGIWRGQDKVETNTAVSASIVGKMYNNLCGISDKEKPQCKADTEQKIIQMSPNNTAAMLENMADIRKEQEHQRRTDYDNI